MWNHSEAIWVSLRHLSPGTDALAAHWSLKALDRQGGWSQDGCQLVQSDSSTSTMRCSLLSNYAVLQVIPYQYHIHKPDTNQFQCQYNSFATVVMVSQDRSRAHTLITLGKKTHFNSMLYLIYSNAG